MAELALAALVPIIGALYVLARKHAHFYAGIRSVLMPMCAATFFGLLGFVLGGWRGAAIVSNHDAISAIAALVFGSAALAAAMHFMDGIEKNGG